MTLMMLPIDEPHHQPPIEIVAHPVSNSVIYAHVHYGPGGLPDILRLLRWCALLRI